MKGFAVLKDIARIRSPKVYENLCSKSPDFKNQQLLFVPKQFTFHFLLSSLKEPLHLDNKEGTLIMLKDKPNPVITFSYLSFYLNSIAGKAQYIFDNEQRTYRKTITKKILSDCIILFPSDKTIQYYYSIVQEILDRNATSKTEDKYTHLWKDMFTELREGLAIELTMADELKNMA